VGNSTADRSAVELGDGGRSVATVLQDILGNIDHMVRGEVRLAKAEALAEIRSAAASVRLLAIGVGIAYLALAFFLLAAFLSLEATIRPWAAALVVAAGAAVLATAVIARGITTARREPMTYRVKLVSRTERTR
jgi:hypothetical protein